MKKTLQYTILTAVLMFASVNLLNAQPPHPGQKSDTQAVSGTRIGETAGAPVGTADILLVTLAALYGAYRLSSRRKPEEA